MKKKVVLLLTTLLVSVAMITGCGDKENNKDNVENNNVENNDVENNDVENDDVENNDVENNNVEKSPMLTVENDEFSFDELALMVGEKDSEMLKFLGVKESADTYEALLYGQEVTLAFECEANIVEKITVTFTTSDAEAISNATAEQLGQDGAAANGVTSWLFEEINVELSDDGDKCVIEIFK